MLDLLESTRQVVLRGSVCAASATFFDGDAVADPGAVTVAITRHDGSAVVSGNAAGVDVGPRTIALSAADTATLDLLTCEWTSAEFGTLTTYVEVAGGFVAAIGQINAVLDQRGAIDDAVSAEVPLAAKQAARTIATDALEKECGVAFAPRFARDRFDGTSGDLLLPTPRVTAVRSASQVGTSIDPSTIEVTRVGGLYRAMGWNGGRRAFDISWEHGYRTPPGDVARAVALVSVYTLLDGPWDDRGYGVVDEGGFARLLTAGVSGAAFSIPEVQAVVQRYGNEVAA